MIKGVNRQVVEVSDTGSDYFEKALFFVNPKYYGLTDGKLREKAQTLMSATGAPPKQRKKEKKHKWQTALAIMASAAVGSIITAVSTIIF